MKRRDEISAESGSEMDEDLEEDMEDDLDEYDEQLDDSEDAADEEEQDENTKFLAQGADLDLPDEDDDDSSIDDDSDGKLDAMYKELGIKRDVTKKVKEKGDASKKEVKQSAKQELIAKLISLAKNDPSATNLANAMRLVKQVFNSHEKEEEDEAGGKKKKKP